MSNPHKYFYRYEWVNYAVYDFDGELTSSPLPNVKLELRVFELVKETEKGYWIGIPGILDVLKRWIPKQSKKRFAYPTKEEALNSFTIRTKKRIDILQFQVDCCNSALQIAKTVSIT